jgi:CDP-paratose 2-epimerase
MKALVTGAGGPIGSRCARMLAGEGWDVLGIDNDLRRHFFGPLGSTVANVQALTDELPRYRHLSLDIRERESIHDLFREYRPEFIIHTAAEPLHDKAASIPYDDFDVNAVGTLSLLMAARDFCAESPFCFSSTNKVYGDRPNHLPLVEHATRYDFAQIDG